jgi:cyclophilin family peptidyl-prolyl cis-trans isomerase
MKTSPFKFALMGSALLSVVLAGCGATPTPKAGSVQQWSAPPAMTIDTAKQYIATLHLARGDIVIKLLPQEAPLTVNSFVFLARQGFYDGVTFHRVIPGFMAQGGDPTGTGSGGPGYYIPNETGSGRQFDTEGLVAMANAGPDTNGSQFFITYGPAPHLNGGYTIFGRVTSGMNVALSITPRDPADPTAPPGDAINSVTIEEK